jgi:hypothetical protein
VDGEEGWEAAVRTGVSRRSSRSAWGLLAVAAACWAVSAILLMRTELFQEDPATLLDHWLAQFLAFGLFTPVGAVIIAHRPRHAIGWVYAAIGQLAATGTLAQQYAVYGYVDRAEVLPGALLAAWLQASWVWPTVILAFVFMPLLFPTGRLPSPRWRAVVIVATLLAVLAVVLTTLTPAFAIAGTTHVVANPLGRGWSPVPDESMVLITIALGCISAAIGSLGQRFRRARGVERQQLQWLVYAMVVFALANLALILVPPAGSFDTNGLPVLVWGVVIAPVPLATGIAIVRHRLFDIDRLVNRTLVYGLVTVVLGAVYILLVVTVALLVGGLGEEVPEWGVAASTLAVAALFRPVRRRVQAVVDRRFYRQRYDAAKTVAAFNARLRDRVDLEELTVDLLAVTDEAMQPLGRSLWLQATVPPRPSPVAAPAGGRGQPGTAAADGGGADQ